MKSRSTYVRSVRAALLLLCVFGLAGCGSPDVEELARDLAALPSPPYTVSVKTHKGTGDQPDYAVGWMKSQAGGRLRFCVFEHPERRVRPTTPNECAGLPRGEDCGMYFMTDLGEKSKSDPVRDAEADAVLGDRLRMAIGELNEDYSCGALSLSGDPL